MPVAVCGGVSVWAALLVTLLPVVRDEVIARMTDRIIERVILWVLPMM